MDPGKADYEVERYSVRVGFAVVEEALVFYVGQVDLGRTNPFDTTSRVDSRANGGHVVALRALTDDLGKDVAQRVNEQGLRAPWIALDGARERDEKLDELTVGKGMTQIDAVPSRLDLLLLERDRGAGQQRQQL